MVKIMSKLAVGKKIGQLLLKKGWLNRVFYKPWGYYRNQTLRLQCLETLGFRPCLVPSGGMPKRLDPEYLKNEVAKHLGLKKGKVKERIEKAIKLLERVPEDGLRGPEYNFAYRNLATLYLTENSIEQKGLNIDKLKIIIEVFKEVVEIKLEENEDPKKYGKAHYYLGMYYLARGKKDEAWSSFNKAKELGVDIKDELLEALEAGELKFADSHLAKVSEVYGRLKGAFAQISETTPPVNTTPVAPPVAPPVEKVAKLSKEEAEVYTFMVKARKAPAEKKIKALFEALDSLREKPRKGKIAKFAAEISDKLTEEGERLFEGGEYDEAVRLLKGAVDARKDNEKAKNLLSKISRMFLREAEKYRKKPKATEGDYQKALELYKKVVQADPDHSYAWTQIGYLYRKLEKHDEALNSYQKALELDENNIHILTGLGKVYEEIKEYNKALNLYLKAEEIAPSDIHAKMGSTNVFAKLDEYEKAIQKAIEARDIEPDNWHIWLKLADLYGATRQFNTAVYACTRVLRLDPGNSAAEQRLKDIESMKKRAELEKTMPPERAEEIREDEPPEKVEEPEKGEISSEVSVSVASKIKQLKDTIVDMLTELAKLFNKENDPDSTARALKLAAKVPLLGGKPKIARAKPGRKPRVKSDSKSEPPTSVKTEKKHKGRQPLTEEEIQRRKEIVFKFLQDKADRGWEISKEGLKSAIIGEPRRIIYSKIFGSIEIALEEFRKWSEEKKSSKK